MGKRIAGGLGVLASIAGILGLLVALNIIHPFGPPKDACIQGYVWREAVPGDHVCVTPATHDQAQYDNSQAQSRVADCSTQSCPYGKDQCIQGYVWRGAVPDDHVCVTPETRDQTQYDNSQAPSRVVPP